MRYIANATGYLLEVSFGAAIKCNGKSCTEYTGDVPAGYDSLIEWFDAEAQSLHRWKIVGGNLTLDAFAPEPAEPVEGPMVRIRKLWENTNPTGNFYAQTVNLDLSEYDGVSIYYKAYPDAVSIIPYGFIPKGTQAMLQFVTTAKNVLNRTAAVTDAGVEFGPGQANGENSNTAPAPLAIYGWAGIVDCTTRAAAIREQ